MGQLNPPDLYKTPPPAFGHALLPYFCLDPQYINLNNGSFGSLPLPVLSACNALTREIDKNPDYFHRLAFQPLLVSVRKRLAQLIGAETDECVIVPNTSHGINTVLRNFEWEKGDIIVTCNTTYLSISRTAQHISDVPPYSSTYPLQLQFPTTHANIVSQFRAHLRALPRSNPNSKSQKVVAVIDSIVSNPGVLMPWKTMVQVCKEEGVWSVVDAAHSIGQEMDIDLGKAQPDFWVSNCHKWLYAKRPCAVLYVPKRNQHIIKSTIPTSYAYVTVSPRNGGASTFIEQFEWNGTIDYVPYLSVNAALDFRMWLGGEKKINTYCHALALEGGRRLAEVMGTRVMGPVEVVANMVNVELPLPGQIRPTREVDMLFSKKMLVERWMYAAVYLHGGRWWVRCSAQVWNEVGDFEKLGNACVEVCGEIVREVGNSSGVGRAKM